MIILPMAGLSSRFFKAGYDKPKYMLDLHGIPVFDHALGSFANLFSTDQFLIICRDVYGTPQFVEERVRALGLAKQNVDIVVLSKETDGQAETVAEGLRQSALNHEQLATIFNIDTFRPQFQYPTTFDHRAVDGYLEVFRAPGDHWSFVRPDTGTDRVTEVTEKVRISDLCSNGLYHFRSADFFLSLFGNIADKDPTELQGSEYYVAPLYNIALKAGADIRFVEIPTEAMRFCGTPDEYQTLLACKPFQPSEIDA